MSHSSNKKPKNKKKKNSALAAAASRKLGGIGAKRFTPEEIAHTMMHAEERGETERVPLEDGTWGWRITGPDGQPRILKATPDILAALERFEREGHPAHLHEHGEGDESEG